MRTNDFYLWAAMHKKKQQQTKKKKTSERSERVSFLMHRNYS